MTECETIIGEDYKPKEPLIKDEDAQKAVRAWKKEKGLTLAYDICEFLANNLDLEDGDENQG